MGCYAFFNTGLDYTFITGIQQIQDILEFGGKEHIQATEPGVSDMISWTPRDLPVILQELTALAKELEVSLPNFSGYDCTLGGTYNLKNFLGDSLDLDYILSYRYLLGCIIYHQLLYRPDLSANFRG